MSGKLAYIFLTDRVEESEAVVTIDMLRRAKINVVSVSLTDSMLISGSHAIQFKADKMFDEVDFSDGDILVLPGGPGTANYKTHEGLLAVIKEYYESNRFIAAICAAPTVFCELGLLDGKTAVCYPGLMDKYSGVLLSDKPVVRDGFIITSKGPATVMHFAAEIIEALEGAETAKSVCDGFCFNLGD